jgi:hypothetical protein
MKKINLILWGLSAAMAGSLVASAQDAPAAPSIPMVLQIIREYVKPYKGGMAHDKTESAISAAFAKAKFPYYYVGLTSMSGPARGLYLTDYNSFADWEKGNKIVEKNPTLNAEVEKASAADGELLESVDTGVFTYDADLSYHPHADISHARYMELTVFIVKPGHAKDFEKLTKMVKAAHEKGGTSAHWATFEAAFGREDGTYIALTSATSMSEIDTDFMDYKKFGEAMGEEGMKKLDELYGATVTSSHSELFSINPRQSYVNPDWIAADPDFWKPKAAAAAKPAADKKDAKP